MFDIINIVILTLGAIMIIFAVIAGAEFYTELKKLKIQLNFLYLTIPFYLGYKYLIHQERLNLNELESLQEKYKIYKKITFYGVLSFFVMFFWVFIQEIVKQIDNL